MKHANNLTPAELERLTLVLEECAEVQQVVCKIIRFGYESCHPKDPSHNNRWLLEKELGDLIAAIDFMSERHDVNNASIGFHCGYKKSEVKQYLRHQEE